MIKFYNTTDIPYGVFSNFAPYGFYENNIFWKTSEHWFQAQKYAYPDNSKHEQYYRIAKAETPKSAAALGRSRRYEIRSDWDLELATIHNTKVKLKEKIMYQALIQKFTSYPMLQHILLSTKDQEIIEDSHVDSYWGCGKDGQGLNRLGVLLMMLREDIKNGKL